MTAETAATSESATRAAPKILTESEVTDFRRDGFLIPRHRLDTDTRAHLQGLTERIVARNPHLGDAPMASPHVPGSGVQGLKSEPGWLEFPTQPRVLDLVEQLIGPDIILWGTTVFYKPALEGRVVPWHRDGRYWPIEPLATTSVWIAVTDSHAGNGCLRCIPGSHHARTIGQHFRSESDEVQIPETLAAGELDESAAVDIELEAGQMVVFDVYTAHGSSRNRTGEPRIGYAMRYMPATSHYSHANVPVPDSRGAAHHTRPLMLVRGNDRSGRNDFRIGHPEQGYALRVPAS